MKKNLRKSIFAGFACLSLAFVVSCNMGVVTPQTGEQNNPADSGDKKDTPSSSTDDKSNTHEECEWEKTFGGYEMGMVDFLNSEIQLFNVDNGRWGYWADKVFEFNLKAGDTIEIDVKPIPDSEIPEYTFIVTGEVDNDKNQVDSLEGEYRLVSEKAFTSQWHYKSSDGINYSRVNRPADGGDPEAYNNAAYEKIFYYYKKVNGNYERDDENGNYVKRLLNKKSYMTFYDNSWAEMSFSDFTFTTGYTWNNSSEGVTGCEFKRDVSDHTINIKLSAAEAKTILEKKLRINGYGITVTQIRIPGKVYNYKTVEAQYLMKREERNDFLKEYRAATGWKEPFVVITTKDAEEITKKDYYEAVIDVINCDEDYELTAKRGQVKVRGNSTADYSSSKPYRIKFKKKQPMLGLHNGNKYKSWVLLNTNAGMDYLGFNLVKEIYKTGLGSFKYYGSDCTFVHVFVNEKYVGMRLLCEQSQPGKERVDIAEPEEGDTSIKTGYFLCLDNYAYSKYLESPCFSFNDVKQYNVKYKNFNENYDKQTGYGNVTFEYPDCTVNQWIDGFSDGYILYGNPINSYVTKKYQFKDVLNHDIKNYGINWGMNPVEKYAVDNYLPEDYYSIKSDTWCDEQNVFIAKWMNNVWEVCYQSIVGDKNGQKHYLAIDDKGDLIASSYSTSKDVISEVIDVESLANEMILEELIRDNDVGAGSFYMAVDFTKAKTEKYGRLTFECPWDHNWAYNSHGDGVSLDTVDEEWYGSGTKYYAGAYQPSDITADGCERSNYWFTLLNKEKWFREIARQRWEQIGASNLQKVCNDVVTNSANAREEGSFDINNCYNFVKNRITEIESTLWLE